MIDEIVIRKTAEIIFNTAKRIENFEKMNLEQKLKSTYKDFERAWILKI